MGNIGAAARLIGRVAPAKASAVIGTDMGKCADLRLRQLPNQGRVVWSGLQDDGGTAGAGAVDVKAQAADINEFAEGRIAIAFPFQNRKLIYGARGNKRNRGRPWICAEVASHSVICRSTSLNQS